MAYDSLESLVTRLNGIYASRGSLDCMLTVGEQLQSQVTVAVWNKSEPYTIEAPINLKWVKGDVMYVRTSRSPSNGQKNTWVVVSTLNHALEIQRWDRAKPAGWDLLQHATNIDDPHRTRGEFEGGNLTGPLVLAPDQPQGPNYAASQQFVLDHAAKKFEYASREAATEHVIEHGLRTTTPAVTIYVENQLSFTEVEIIDEDILIVRFPYPQNCEIGIR